MLTLVQIATNRCILNASRISDVGETPYHLLEPILRRFNAKQLAHLEESSPQLTPHSDKLWPKLIEKDFPDRPIYQGHRTTSKTLDDSMPNKTLYYRYQSEKELFRSDSAARLKAMTEKLQRQKLANAITTVPQLLRDPTVRRSTYIRPVYRSSVIERARIDARRRIFPNNHNQHGYSNGITKQYHSRYDSNGPIRRRPPTQFNTQLTQRSERERISLYSASKLEKPNPTTVKPVQKNIKTAFTPKAQRSMPKSSLTAVKNPNSSDSKDSKDFNRPLEDKGPPKASKESQAHLGTVISSTIVSRSPKRPAPATLSVFLSRKRPRPPVNPVKPPQEKSPEPPSKLRAVRSSIFQR